MSPSDRSTRREFIAITSSAALGAAVPLAGAQPDAPVPHPALVPVWDEIPYSSEQLLDNAPSALSAAIALRKSRCPGRDRSRLDLSEWLRGVAGLFHLESSLHYSVT